MAHLTLDAPREEVLTAASRLIGAAWKSFDQARPSEPPIGPRLQELLTAPLPETPTPVLAALEDAYRILDESIAQARPRYFAFIGSSGLPIGALADALASCFDVNLARWAAAATEVEEQALRWVAEFVGFPGRHGAFTSGGTLSNLTGLAAAREQAIPGSRTAGLGGSRPALYASAEAHYSVVRAAELLGLGSRSVRVIPVDERHRLRVDQLEQAIAADRAAGATPVAVVASAGTTLTGAVDPLTTIADVCERHGVWLHVDGAYGLPAAATRSHGHLFRGVERADSISLDAHKWLYLPKACSVVLLRSEAHLTDAFAHEASYMPHEQGDLHAVDLTIEYSRPFRALKLWLAFHTHGAAAFRAALEHNLALAGLLAQLVRAHPELELALEPELSVVAFRHVPPGSADPDRHNLGLAEALQDDGRVYIASAIIDGRAYLRPCITNYRTTEDDVRALVEVTLEIGRALAA